MKVRKRHNKRFIDMKEKPLFITIRLQSDYNWVIANHTISYILKTYGTSGSIKKKKKKSRRRKQKTKEKDRMKERKTRWK